MAKTTSKPRKLAHFPKSQPAEPPENGAETAVMEPEAEPQTPFDVETQTDPSAVHPRRGRPPAGAKALTFFERLATITQKEWEDDRAKIKLYRLAPIINRLMSSEHKFVSIYNEPITEERLKVDHGSGRYRLYLNYRAPGQKDVEIDRVELDILDQNFPPKVPPGEWMDDNKNRQWAWAKPPGAPGFHTNGTAPAPAAGPVDPLAAFGTFMDIQDRIESRTQPAAQPAPSAANDLLTQLRLLKEVTQPAPAAPAENPLTLAIQLMTVMNQQRAENPIVDMMRAELQAVREELKEARKTPPPAQKSFMDQLMEMATDDKLDKVKRVMGIFGGGAGEGAGRQARTTPLELAREFISSPMGANIGHGVGSLLSQMMQPKVNGGPPQYPTVLNQQHPNGTVPPVENPEVRIQRIGAAVTRPMLQYFMRNGNGADFAQSMFDMSAEDYVFMRQLGAENIVQRYRQFPEAWNVIQYPINRENEFIEFIRDFCSWNPDEDEGPAPPNNGDDGIVELEEEARS